MSKEKQIEEMREDLVEIFDEEYEKRRIITADFTAIKLADKGYRKQSEGEWTNNNGRTLYKCSVCGHTRPYDAQADDISYWTCNFCPNCGAKMKGGE